MLIIQAIPALGDNLNYIWLIRPADKNTVLIVDPGEAAPVIAKLTEQSLQPIAILNTHRHWDHVDGIAELAEYYKLPVYGPKNETIPCRTHPLTKADTINLPNFPTITILDIPGHTEGHIAYLMDEHLFCGDTLFGAGCGRLLGGTAKQLYESLQHIMALPPETKIYSGHEYTTDNLRFAAMIEPDNLDISQRIVETATLCQQAKPTLPSNLKTELLSNPFLRCHLPTIHKTVEHYADKSLADSQAVFSVLRAWKTNG